MPVRRVRVQVREFRAILNKLTPEKFDRLFEQLLEKITSADILKKSITTIFEKAVAEPTFCFLYAELCLRLRDVGPSAAARDGCAMLDGRPEGFKARRRLAARLLHHGS